MPGCAASPGTRAGHLASISARVSRRGPGTKTSPRFPLPSTISSASVSVVSGFIRVSTRLAAACDIADAPPSERSSSTESTRPQPSTLLSTPVVSDCVSARQRLAQLDAVARRERVALGLSVVAQRDDVVAPGRAGGHLLQDGQHVVEPAEGRQ